ncbi:MAG: hypothetical protein ABIS35_09700 [Terracoccus sp.]
MTPHLRGNVRAYVDRGLPPALLHLYDRHVVCCAMCRSAADQERRIIASLRTDTGVPTSLMSSLMGLGAAPSGPPAPGGPSAHPVPPVPRPPTGFGMPSASFRDPVPTVRPSSPPLHRSPMRAAVLASIAAGASVAAAWGLAVAPLPTVGRPASARVPAGVASFGSAGLASVTAVRSLGSTVSVTGRSGLSTARLTPVGTGAAPTTVQPVDTVLPVDGVLPVDVVVSMVRRPWLVTSTTSTGPRTGPVRATVVGSAQSGP